MAANSLEHITHGEQRRVCQPDGYNRRIHHPAAHSRRHTEVYLVGMSNGGAFSLVAGRALNLNAAVVYCASGSERVPLSPESQPLGTFADKTITKQSTTQNRYETPRGAQGTRCCH